MIKNILELDSVCCIREWATISIHSAEPIQISNDKSKTLNSRDCDSSSAHVCLWRRAPTNEWTSYIVLQIRFDFTGDRMYSSFVSCGGNSFLFCVLQSSGLRKFWIGFLCKIAYESSDWNHKTHFLSQLWNHLFVLILRISRHSVARGYFWLREKSSFICSSRAIVKVQLASGKKRKGRNMGSDSEEEVIRCK